MRTLGRLPAVLPGYARDPARPGLLREETVKRNLKVHAVGALITALVLLLTACPAAAGTVVRKQHQVPDGKDIKVERWCLHVQPPNPDTKPLIYCRDDAKEYNRYKVGDKHPK